MNRRAFLAAPLALVVPAPDAVPMPFANMPTAIAQWMRDQAFIRRREMLRQRDAEHHQFRLWWHTKGKYITYPEKYGARPI